MKTSSAKAKGRRPLKRFRELLLKWLPLEPGDITVTPSGVTGVDLQLSPEALRYIPYGVEGKAEEALSIWGALRQAESHCKGLSLRRPLLVFTRNRTPLYVALEAEEFVRLLARACEVMKLSDFKITV